MHTHPYIRNYRPHMQWLTGASTASSLPATIRNHFDGSRGSWRTCTRQSHTQHRPSIQGLEQLPYAMPRAMQYAIASQLDRHQWNCGYTARYQSYTPAHGIEWLRAIQEQLQIPTNSHLHVFEVTRAAGFITAPALQNTTYMPPILDPIQSVQTWTDS